MIGKSTIMASAADREVREVVQEVQANIESRGSRTRLCWLCEKSFSLDMGMNSDRSAAVTFRREDCNASRAVASQGKRADFIRAVTAHGVCLLQFRPNS